MVPDRVRSDCAHLNESRAAFYGNCGAPLRRQTTPGTVPPTTMREEIGSAAPKSSDCEPNRRVGHDRAVLGARVPDLQP